MEKKKLLQQNASGWYPDPADWGKIFIAFFFTKYFISSSHLRLSFPVGLFPLDLQLQNCMQFYLRLFSAT